MDEVHRGALDELFDEGLRCEQPYLAVDVLALLDGQWQLRGDGAEAVDAVGGRRDIALPQLAYGVVTASLKWS